MKIVADTNVLISALGWKGPSHGILQLAFKEKIKLALSPDLLTEFKDVSQRPRLGFSKTQTDDFLNALLQVCEVVSPTTKQDIIKEDDDDNRVLECALEAKAKMIVSGDQHLLSLTSFQNMPILKPRNALELLERH